MASNPADVLDKGVVAPPPASHHHSATYPPIEMTQARKAELSGQIPPEPLCSNWTSGRFVTDPKEAEVFQMYKLQVGCFWTAEEIDLAHDHKHWKALTKDERHFLTHVLAFFAAADGIINENLTANFASEITLDEARKFYHFQMAMEDIHSEVYSQLITTYIKDHEERARLMRAVETIPAVKAKADWALQWMNPELASLAERMVAFVCVEGIAFQGSFCAIFWLKKRGLMPGLCHANELISRDEGMHMRFGALMYSMLVTKLEVARVHEIIRGAVDGEIQFITNAFSCELIGMNAALMTEFVKASANIVCVYLNVPVLYPGSTNPFDWMDLIDIDGKTNYFERRVSEYQKAHMNATASPSRKAPVHDDDESEVAGLATDSAPVATKLNFCADF